MWEAISAVLMSDNAIIVIAFLAFFTMVGWWLSKKGLLNIHTESLTIGAANHERDIIRQQVEYMKLHLEALEASLEKPEGYNPWRGKYIIECLYDQYVEWITFNHINTTPTYIEVKQDRIVSLVESLTVLPEFKTDEFKDMLRADTKQCIEKLVMIRKVYKN